MVVVPPVVAALEIPAESKFVAAARQFVFESAESAGWFDSERHDDVRLMVSETVTNALRAQVDTHVNELIRIATMSYPDRFEITVTDSAGGFVAPPLEAEPPTPDLSKDGGFGLGLIDELSDEAHFTPMDQGTVVRLVIYRDDRPFG